MKKTTNMWLSRRIQFGILAQPLNGINTREQRSICSGILDNWNLVAIYFCFKHGNHFNSQPLSKAFIAGNWRQRFHVWNKNKWQPNLGKKPELNLRAVTQLNLGCLKFLFELKKSESCNVQKVQPFRPMSYASKLDEMDSKGQLLQFRFSNSSRWTIQPQLATVSNCIRRPTKQFARLFARQLEKLKDNVKNCMIKIKIITWVQINDSDSKSFI